MTTHVGIIKLYKWASVMLFTWRWTRYSKTMKRTQVKPTLSLLRPLQEIKWKKNSVRWSWQSHYQLKLKEPRNSSKTSQHTPFKLKLVHYQQLKLTFSSSKKQLAAVHILDVFWKKNSMLNFFTLNKHWRRWVCKSGDCIHVIQVKTVFLYKNHTTFCQVSPSTCRRGGVKERIVVGDWHLSQAVFGSYM